MGCIGVHNDAVIPYITRGSAFSDSDGHAEHTIRVGVDQACSQLSEVRAATVVRMSSSHTYSHRLRP